MFFNEVASTRKMVYLFLGRAMLSGMDGNVR